MDEQTPVNTSDATADPRSACQRQQSELAILIERYCGGVDGVHETGVPRLAFFRTTTTHGPMCSVYRSVLVIAPQGAKRIVLGEEAFEYDRTQYLLTSVELPVVGQVIEASADAPYLCAVLDIDLRQVSELLGEHGQQLPAAPMARGMGVRPLDEGLADAMLRLARLVESPRDIPALAPLAEREILYRLLAGEQGARLRHTLLADSQGHRVARAIGWLKDNFHQPLSIDALAERVNMSPSSLHHHFKAMTAMSPLQYQKHIRLQEARRLLLAEPIDAATVARRVGYESPSQFSREYRRLFGAPPGQDAARLRLG